MDTNTDLLEIALEIARTQSRLKSRPPIQVEDLFSAAQVGAWQAIEKWKGEGNFAAFAVTIINRRIVDEQRHLIGRGIRGKSRSVPAEAADWQLVGPIIKCPTCERPLQRTDPTTRELEIWKLVADGLTSKDIGMRLKLSYKTVEAHLYNLRKVLRLEQGHASRSVLTRLWIERQPNGSPVEISLEPLVKSERITL